MFFRICLYTGSCTENLRNLNILVTQVRYNANKHYKGGFVMSFMNSLKVRRSDDQIPLQIILLEVLLFTVFVYKMFDG